MLLKLTVCSGTEVSSSAVSEPLSVLLPKLSLSTALTVRVAQVPANTPLLYWALRSTTSALVPLTKTCLSVLGEPLASSSTLLMFITRSCLPSVLKSKISTPLMRAATAGSVRSSVLVGGVLVEVIVVIVVFRLSANKPLTLFKGTLVNVDGYAFAEYSPYRLYWPW